MAENKVHCLGKESTFFLPHIDLSTFSLLTDTRLSQSDGTASAELSAVFEMFSQTEPRRIRLRMVQSMHVRWVCRPTLQMSKLRLIRAKRRAIKSRPSTFSTLWPLIGAPVSSWLGWGGGLAAEVGGEWRSPSWPARQPLCGFTQ